MSVWRTWNFVVVGYCTTWRACPVAAGSTAWQGRASVHWVIAHVKQSNQLIRSFVCQLELICMFLTNIRKNSTGHELVRGQYNFRILSLHLLCKPYTPDLYIDWLTWQSWMLAQGVFRDLISRLYTSLDLVLFNSEAWYLAFYNIWYLVNRRTKYQCCVACSYCAMVIWKRPSRP